MKNEWLRRIQVPLRREAMRREIATYLPWYEEYRPHQGLDGRTPREVYEGEELLADAGTATKQPRTLVVRFHEGRRELPIVELKKAA